MRSNRVLLAAAVLWTAAASLSLTAFAHGGGGYRDGGPPGEVPPDSREPSDPPPPPESPDPVTASLRWWSLHNLPEIVGHTRAARAPELRVSRSVVDATIAPALRRLARGEGVRPLIRSQAILALARAGDASIAPTLRAFVDADDESLPRSVAENAALALGLLRDNDSASRAALVARLTRPDARNTYVRQFAAVGLGLLGADAEHAAARVILDTISREQAGSGVRPACLLALGLLGDDTALPELLAWARGARAPGSDAAPLCDLERAFAVEALGRFEDGAASLAALDAVTRLVMCRHSVESYGVRRSAATALGRIAGRCDAGARRAAAVLLRGVADDDAGDELERRLALIALGRLGAAPGTRLHLRSWIAEYLRCDMEKGRGGAAAFAAVALALVGRAVQETTGVAAEDDVRAPLRVRFAAEENADRRGAYALGAGVVGDLAAAEPLRRTVVGDEVDLRLRGWCAVALGMMGDTESCGTIRAALLGRLDGEFRIQCAMSLDLLGDRRVVDDLLVSLLDREASQYELTVAALALGQVGDERAVAPLIDIAEAASGRYSDFTRTFAVAALGQLADPNDIPVLDAIRADVNYLARDPVIAELLAIH